MLDNDSSVGWGSLGDARSKVSPRDYGIDPPSRMSRALIGGLKPTLHYSERIEFRDVIRKPYIHRNNGGASPTLPLWAKGCYTEARRGKEFCTETIYT